MESQQTNTPPVLPTVPVVPPPQTVFGTLSQDGKTSMFDTIMPGQPPNEQFWFARDEMSGIINVSTTQGPETLLAELDILKCAYDQNNPEKVPALALVVPNATASWQITMPRTIALNTAAYFNSTISYTFWAIKPPGTRGKIRFVYSPYNIKLTEENSTTPQTPNAVYDNMQRTMIWSWDLEKQDTFKLDFHGHNPISSFPTTNSIFPGVYPDLQPDKNGNRTGRPRFNTIYGTLTIFVQNRYTPGSIFPSSFDIIMFKSMPDCKTYVERGPRTELTRFVI